MDRLDALLSRFSASTELFHAGPICGINDFQPERGLGQLHLLRAGQLVVEHLEQPPLRLEQPSLLIYPRPTWHRFITDAEHGADLVCAFVRLGDDPRTPWAESLPETISLPLDRLPDSQPVLQALFDEALAPRCGRQRIVDRLFEVVLIQLFRHLMQQRMLDRGLFAGLGHPQLARSLVALHREPARPWTLESMAAEAGMSRSAFAREFHAVVGQPPGDYLIGWRLLLARQQLRAGEPLKRIAQAVGYGTEAALSRAFKTRHGLSPRAWLKQEAEP